MTGAAQDGPRGGGCRDAADSSHTGVDGDRLRPWLPCPWRLGVAGGGESMTIATFDPGADLGRRIAAILQSRAGTCWSTGLVDEAARAEIVHELRRINRGDYSRSAHCGGALGATKSSRSTGPRMTNGSSAATCTSGQPHVYSAVVRDRHDPFRHLPRPGPRRWRLRAILGWRLQVHAEHVRGKASRRQRQPVASRRAPHPRLATVR